jgi:hypothetical protein
MSESVQGYWEQPKPHPDLRSLDRLVGAWRLPGRAGGAGHLRVDGTGLFLISKLRPELITKSAGEPYLTTLQRHHKGR